MTPTTRRRQPSFAGTGALLRFLLRRDRVRIALWVLGVGAMGAYFAHAVQMVAETQEELHSLVMMYSDPVGRMMTGPGFGMEDPSHERFYAGGYALYLYILVALMSVFTVVRHTRVEEQTGRAELVRANVVGRHAMLTAALVLTSLANLMASLLIWATALSAGYPMEGSALIATGALLTGLFFSGAAAVSTQCSESSRGAAGMAGGVIGLAFLLRMGGDGAQLGGTTLSWFSPLAWPQHTAPYVDDRWWPLLLALGFAVVLIWLGYWLSSKRDVAASLLPTRLGRSVARPWLGSPLGLAARTLKGTLRGWGIALLVTSLVFGGFAQTMVDAADDLPEDLAQILAGEDMVLSFLAFVVLFMAVFLSAAGVSAIQQMRSEESHGRAEYVLSSPVGRTSWLGAHLAVLVIGLLLILVLIGLGMGLGAAASLEEDGGRYFSELLLASLAQAVQNLDLFGHLAQYPVEDIEWTPVLLLSGLGLMGLSADLTGWSHREVNRV